MRLPRRRLWIACVCSVVVAVGVTTVAHAAVTSVEDPTLSTAFEVGTSGEGAAPVVDFVARNTSSGPVQVLASDLPRGRQLGEVLAVARDGVALPYHGRLVKQLPSAAADYLTIAAGATYRTSVQLAEDYDLSRAGTYSVTLASRQMAVKTRSSGGQRARVAATPAQLKTSIGFQRPTPRPVAGSTTTSSPAPQGPGSQDTNAPSPGGQDTGAQNPGGGDSGGQNPGSGGSATGVGLAATTISFRSCSSDQQSQLKQAVAGAAQYASKGKSWLSSNPSGGTPYTTWFGAYSSGRFNHISSAFSGIVSEFSSKTVTLDCSSSESYMAYVYANQPYVIYVCRGYWGAAMTGYDSKSGTLVHESSHFTVNGGAQDHVYGVNEGKSLAKSSPDRAVYNADNIEHFAESL